MEENNFDGAILSSEMFLYGNGLFSFANQSEAVFATEFFKSQ